jgi:hypothetical protein
MKKTIALISSLLVFAGLKAQINSPVKKETGQPVTTKPVLPADSLKGMKENPSLKITKTSGTADSLKAVKGISTIKQIKVDQIKQNNQLPMKENSVPAQPVIKH